MTPNYRLLDIKYLITKKDSINCFRKDKKESTSCLLCEMV